MIVVATADFEVYHEVVTELRERGVVFTTVEPGDPLPGETKVVVTGNDDEVDWEGELVRARAGQSRRAVDEALAVVRGGEGQTIIGVDPGPRPGIAVLHGDVVVAVFHVPLDDAVDVIRRELDDAVEPIVRIGDGARLQGARIVNELDDVQVELVDETGTTPYLGTGVRTGGDVLAATNIARIEGEVVDEREIEPTEGELRVIQTRSRERSGANRTISRGLARRVAAGDLTLDEAIDEHRVQTDEE